MQLQLAINVYVQYPIHYVINFKYELFFVDFTIILNKIETYGHGRNYDKNRYFIILL